MDAVVVIGTVAALLVAPAVSAGDNASLASNFFFCFFSLVWTAMSLALTASLTCCSVRIDPLYAWSQYLTMKPKMKVLVNYLMHKEKRFCRYNVPIISFKTSLGIAGFGLEPGILGQALPERDMLANSSGWYKASMIIAMPLFLDLFELPSVFRATFAFLKLLSLIKTSLKRKTFLQIKFI